MFLEIARQLEVERNAAASKVKHLNRKLADITDNSQSEFCGRLKRRRTHHNSVSESALHSDEEDVDTAGSDMARSISADENFVYQAGHKFFLLYAPWIYSGDEIFDYDVDEHFNPAERFENDRGKLQGELMEIYALLGTRFQHQALHQRWLQRQASFVYIL